MNKIIKFILPLLVFLAAPVEKTFAQYYFYDGDYYDTPLTYEVGTSIGIMNCLTDLGGQPGIGGKFLKDYNIGYNNLDGSVYFGVMYKFAVGLRLEGTFGSVGADDNILKNTAGGTEALTRYYRNLNFRSKIQELSLIAEFHPLYLFIDWPGKDVPPPKFSPYFLIGVGYFHFNPQANLDGRWVDLQPLHTEGEGLPEYPQLKEYKLTQLNMPIGGGLKYDVNGFLTLRLEVSDRILFTDYLDDVSTKYVDPSVFPKYLNGQQLSDALALYLRDKNLVPPYIASPGNLAIGHPGSKRGTSTNNDSYFTINFKIGLTIGREKIN